MATVNLRLDAKLITDAKMIGEAMNRSAAKQVEHWARIGRIMEDNPDLTYEFVKDVLVSKAEADTGQADEYRFG